jgi:hypothetical protein
VILQQIYFEWQICAAIRLDVSKYYSPEG